MSGEDGAPVDVGDAVDGRDGGLDDWVSYDGPNPVELVLLRGGVAHAQIGRGVIHKGRPLNPPPPYNAFWPDL